MEVEVACEITYIELILASPFVGRSRPSNTISCEFVAGE